MCHESCFHQTQAGCGKNWVLKIQSDTSRFVYELRAHTGLTQEQFAAKLGVTFPTINRWENGRAQPSPLALKQIEALLRELGDAGRGVFERYFGKQEKL
jgi:putative transcriptional regulator